jgi:hypothetical protein
MCELRAVVQWPYSHRMAIRTELTVRLSQAPRALDRVFEVLAGDGINLLAICLEGGGTLRIVADNPLNAAAKLRELRYEVVERDVLYTTVPNEPGSMSRTVRLLTDAGVTVEYAYSACLDRMTLAVLVLGVPDAERASASSGI